MSDLYDIDVSLWSEHQSGLLRRRAAGELVNEAELDWPNIAEEIESLGKSERSRLRSHIATVLLHLIKLQASPAIDPRNGWRASIRNGRREIKGTLKDSPSLRSAVSRLIAEETPGAREDAAAAITDYGEQPRVDIGSLTFTEDQVIGDWFPDD
nr:DUF29 domain-containing protein [uncultured Rhodopila sp.]